jgi:DnaK suppressor protein
MTGLCNILLCLPFNCMERTMTTSSLTPSQRDSLLMKLERQLVELGGELRSEREDARDNVESLHGIGVHDKGEESATNSVMAVDRAMIRQHERERSQVQAAIERLREDRYGVCAGCGTAIDVARLTIEPTATRCLSCQQEFESK